MPKNYGIICLLSVLLVNCASTGESTGNNQNMHNPNPEAFGDLYVEAGFSMYMPKEWKTIDFSLKYLIIQGPSENGFSPNIVFGDEAYSGVISAYIDDVISMLPRFYADFEVLDRGSFVTAANLQGEYTLFQGRMNQTVVRQKQYIIPNKEGTVIMAITCSAVADAGTKYDAVFDECVKTFNWTK